VGLDGPKGRASSHEQCHGQRRLDDSGHIQRGPVLAAGALIASVAAEKTVRARAPFGGEKHDQTDDRGSSS
jgi:hypothetical protein